MIYPPKNPKNGNKHFCTVCDKVSAADSDIWPGDTIEYPNGEVWRMNPDADTFTLVTQARKCKVV